MCQPYIESATALSDVMMKIRKKFLCLLGGRNGLPALTWNKKCEGKLELRCSVLVSVCERYTHSSREKKRLQFCITACCNHT